ncbi:unnamed protein product [Lactuca virosa]|uniref:Uncharacterized protein n=1 Tax=Lactuca virosa TaxID=75947 RepID=A0AAU9NWG2_9ASTR|nr:unnamed protein product [Lactuca virosa]
MGESSNTIFERIAWIIIVGLPIIMWSDSNFNKIVSNFGRIIVLFDGIKNRVDLSFVKVSILTSLKKKLNEELSILLNGSSLSEDDDESESEEEEEGFSDTYMNDMEEGEIRKDEATSATPDGDECDDVAVIDDNLPIIIGNSPVPLPQPENEESVHSEPAT